MRGDRHGEDSHEKHRRPCVGVDESGGDEKGRGAGRRCLREKIDRRVRALPQIPREPLREQKPGIGRRED